MVAVGTSGRVVANSAVVRLGGGAMCVFANRRTDVKVRRALVEQHAGRVRDPAGLEYCVTDRDPVTGVLPPLS